MLTAAVLICLLVLILYAPLDLVVTASQVLPGAAANIGRATAGEAITRGECIRLDASAANQAKLSDADAGTDAEAKVDGVALNDAGVGQPVDYQRPGDELTLGAGAAPVVGTVYVLSDTPGGIKPAADLASGDRVTIVGVGKTGNKLHLLLNASNQVVP